MLCPHQVTFGGDFLGPSVLSTLDQGKHIVDLFNKIDPHMITCFGNHEVDVPYQALRQRISEFKGTWLNTNMPAFEPVLPHHIVKNLAADDGTPDARAVAFLGLLIGGKGFENT